ncbi:MAG TPA: hypothetical protein VGE76_00570, partial [Opitutaceae bacterium]
LFLKEGGVGSRAIDEDVFKWFFVFVVVGAAMLMPLFARLPSNRDARFEPLVIGDAILRPLRAATALVNLIDPRSLRKGAKDRKD